MLCIPQYKPELSVIEGIDGVSISLYTLTWSTIQCQDETAYPVYAVQVQTFDCGDESPNSECGPQAKSYIVKVYKKRGNKKTMDLLHTESGIMRVSKDQIGEDFLDADSDGCFVDMNSGFNLIEYLDSEVIRHGLSWSVFTIKDLGPCKPPLPPPNVPLTPTPNVNGGGGFSYMGNDGNMVHNRTIDESDFIVDHRKISQFQFMYTQRAYIQGYDLFPMAYDWSIKSAPLYTATYRAYNGGFPSVTMKNSCTGAETDTTCVYGGAWEYEGYLAPGVSKQAYDKMWVNHSILRIHFTDGSFEDVWQTNPMPRQAPGCFPCGGPPHDDSNDCWNYTVRLVFPGSQLTTLGNPIMLSANNWTNARAQIEPYVPAGAILRLEAAIPC